MDSSDEIEETPLPKICRSRGIGHLVKAILSKLPESPAKGESIETTVRDVVDFTGWPTGTVYEVFAVFEAILLVTKIGQQRYRWHGLSHLHTALWLLRAVAQNQKVYERKLALLMEEKETIEVVVKGVSEEDVMADEEMQAELATIMEAQTLPEDIVFVIEVEEEDTEEPMKDANASCDRSSISIGGNKKIPHITLYQQFVMLFLEDPAEALTTLDFAAQFLYGSPGQEMSDDDVKVGARRLYDVANVLASLKEPILRKVMVKGFCGERTRAMFQYCGPDLNVNAPTYEQLLDLPDFRRKHLPHFAEGLKLLGVPLRPTTLPRSVIERVDADGKDGKRWKNVAPKHHATLIFNDFSLNFNLESLALTVAQEAGVPAAADDEPEREYDVILPPNLPGLLLY